MLFWHQFVCIILLLVFWVLCILVSHSDVDRLWLLLEIPYYKHIIPETILRCERAVAVSNDDYATTRPEMPLGSGALISAESTLVLDHDIRRLKPHIF